MSAPTVHIRHEAFLNMLLSSIETFRRECLGIVFGYALTKTRSHFLVTNAIPLQCVRVRLNTGVEPSKRSDQRLRELFANSGRVFRRLGEFHSHAEWGKYKGLAELSEIDIKDMKEAKHSLEFVVAVASRKKGFLSWEVQPDGGVKGSLGGFNFHLNVYALLDEDEELEPQKLQIVAPLTLKALNRVNGFK